MISSANFKGSLLGVAGREHAQQTPGGNLNSGFGNGRSGGRAGFLSASGQLSWPPAGRFLTVYGQDVMAADSASGGPSRRKLGVTPSRAARNMAADQRK